MVGGPRPPFTGLVLTVLMPSRMMMSRTENEKILTSCNLAIFLYVDGDSPSFNLDIITFMTQSYREEDSKAGDSQVNIDSEPNFQVHI